MCPTASAALCLCVVGDVMDDAKKQLRATAIGLRKAAFDRHGPTAAKQIAAIGLDFLRLPAGSTVSGFAAIRDEINPAQLLAWLHEEGFMLALPVMVGKGLPLVMRAWSPGDALAAAAWGIAEPLDDKPEVFPDVVLVPLLAFDAHGTRLGYGGGFYDRTLAKLRKIKPVTAVGVAYDEQKVDAVPTEVYDQALDWVLTPSGPHKF
jgi:5-formyltetrahydrofolate cyclo-ligase